ncbi:MAG: acyltransferase family protein [Paludibacteraceae bacterium]|nr:acyltransferase family protein [Paludibacteraceae bacterium]
MKRFDYIDYAKGLGMLCVIWGHIMYAGLSARVVYAFHIPLFFFLSGMVFSKDRYDGVITFLKRRVSSLLIPYAIFSVLTWAFWVFFLRISHQPMDECWKPLLETLLARGSEGYLVHNVPLWFVPCLFVVELLYFFMRKCTMAVRVALSLLFALAGCLMVRGEWSYDFTTLPWSIDVALMAIPFYALGNVLVERVDGLHAVEVLFSSHGKKTVIVMLVCFFLLCLGADWNGRVSMGHALLGKSVPLFYLDALCGIVAFLLLCLSLQSLLSGRSNLFVRWLRWWGRNSFTVMAVHNPIKGVVVVAVSWLFGTSSSMVNRTTFYATVACVCVVLLTSLLIYCFKGLFKRFFTIAG